MSFMRDTLKLLILAVTARWASGWRSCLLVNVEITLPVIGLIVRYQGWLDAK